MTPENFVYWLQGYIELSKEKTLTSEQMQVIQEHLNLVIQNVTKKEITVPSPPSLSFPPGKRIC